MKHVIIGGVAGGATAAARIRRISEKDDIVLFEKGEYISYANCGLPYYMGDTIAERDRLFVQTPRSFGRRFKIDVRTKSEVLAIHADLKTVEVKSPDGSTYEESYDRLLLSPGAVPFTPTLPGIFTLRNVADTDAVKNYLDRNRVKRTLVIGGGFRCIRCERHPRRYSRDRRRVHGKRHRRSPQPRQPVSECPPRRHLHPLLRLQVHQAPHPLSADYIP